MQVDVHRIDAEVARAHLADDRVEVRTVAIDIAAHGVDRIGDFAEVLFEQAAGVGVGDHHRRDIRPEAGLECRHIDPAFRRRGDILDAVVSEGGGGGVGAVGAFRHQHHFARIAAGFVRRADREDPAKLTMRAGLGAHGDRRHTGQRAQPATELVDHLQRALHRRLRGERVDVGKAGKPRHLLVEARIVLHRAATEREEAEVDPVVLAAEARVMAHRFRLGQADESDGFAARQPAQTGRGAGVDFGQIDAGHINAADFEQQRLFQH